MKLRTLAIALLFCGSAYSQIYTPANPTIYGQHNLRSKDDSATHIPEKVTNQLNTNDSSAQIFYNRTDSSIWGFSRQKGFFKIGAGGTGGTGGVSSVGAAINGSAITISGSPITTTGTFNFVWVGSAAQYVKGNGTLSTFASDVQTVGDARYSLLAHNHDGRYALLSHSHIAADISDFTTAARNVISAGTGLSYNSTTGVMAYVGTGLGITTINSLTAAIQTLAFDTTSGNTWTITSVGSQHTFKVPSRFLSIGSVPNLSWNSGTHAVDISGGGTPAVIPIATGGGGATLGLVKGGNTTVTIGVGGDLTSNIVNRKNSVATDFISQGIDFIEGTGISLTLTASGGFNHLTITNTGVGLNNLNGLTGPAQTLVTGTSGSDFNIVSVGTAHTFNIPNASASNRGLLSTADWTTFNSKGTGSVTSVAATVPSWLQISGSPITTSGTLAISPATGLAANQFLATPNGTTGAVSLRSIVPNDLPLAAADATTKGAATFNASDFNSASGTISIDYANAQTANGTTKGFLSSTDWTTFNNKGSGNGSVTSVGLATGTTGTDVGVSGSPVTTTGTITLNIPTASATNRGALSSTDWSTFNSKQTTIALTTTGTGNATFNSGTGALNIPNYTQNLSYNSGTHAIDISQSGTSAIIPLAGTSTNGLVTTDQFIMNQYASKEAKKAWFDSSKVIKSTADTLQTNWIKGYSGNTYIDSTTRINLTPKQGNVGGVSSGYGIEVTINADSTSSDANDMGGINVTRIWTNNKMVAGQHPTTLIRSKNLHIVTKGHSAFFGDCTTCPEGSAFYGYNEIQAADSTFLSSTGTGLVSSSILSRNDITPSGTITTKVKGINFEMAGYQAVSNVTAGIDTLGAVSGFRDIGWGTQPINVNHVLSFHSFKSDIINYSNVDSTFGFYQMRPGPIYNYFNGRLGSGSLKSGGTSPTKNGNIKFVVADADGYFSTLDTAGLAGGGGGGGGGTVTSVALASGTTGTDVNISGSPITTNGTITLNIPTASASNRGVLSTTDWSTFNSKQGALTLTTTGTSGASTLVGTTLNIPQYSGTTYTAGNGIDISGSVISRGALSANLIIPAQNFYQWYTNIPSFRLSKNGATQIMIADSSGAADAKWFAINNTSGKLVIRGLTDALAAQSDLFTVQRARVSLGNSATGLMLDPVNNIVGLGTTPSSGATGAFIINTSIVSGLNLQFAGLSSGQLAFGNAGSLQSPSVMSRNSTANQSGLAVFTASADANSSADMYFSVRENALGDFTTMTNTAFKWTRYTTDLMWLNRNGNLGLGIAPTASTRFYIRSTTTSNTNAAIYIDNSAASNTFKVTDDGVTHLGPSFATTAQTLNSYGKSYFGGSSTATAAVHIRASTTTANTGAFKLTSGPPPTTPEIGLMNMENGVWTIDSSNSQRDTIATRKWARNNISGGGVLTTSTLRNANLSGATKLMKLNATLDTATLRNVKDSSEVAAIPGDTSFAFYLKYPLTEQNASTLTLNESGAFVYNNSTANGTFTLPALSTSLGKQYLFKNVTTNKLLTIARAGSDAIYAGAQSETSVVLNPGGSVIIRAGTTSWFAFTEDDVVDREYAISDETTAITTGTAKLTVRAPYGFTLIAVRSSLSVASTSGLPTVDIKENGTTVLGANKLSIDANEKTSTTAATATTIADNTIADDAEITFDITVAGTGAKGLKVKLYFVKRYL